MMIIMMMMMIIIIIIIIIIKNNNDKSYLCFQQLQSIISKVLDHMHDFSVLVSMVSSLLNV